MDKQNTQRVMYSFCAMEFHFICVKKKHFRNSQQVPSKAINICDNSLDLNLNRLMEMNTNTCKRGTPNSWHPNLKIPIANQQCTFVVLYKKTNKKEKLYNEPIHNLRSVNLQCYYIQCILPRNNSSIQPRIKSKYNECKIRGFTTFPRNVATTMKPW